MGKVAPFLMYVFTLISIFTFFLFYSHLLFHPPNPHIFDDDVDPNCDLSEGHWVPDLRRPLYTNVSCPTLPDSKNCLKHGRTDTDFLFWRWKPHSCDLPRFDPKLFLRLLRGKTMGFIGDSVARNHLDSLLCLLSQEEAPMKLYKDSEDRFGTWHFEQHDFTLMVLWSKFLVASEEIMVNGSSDGYSLYMDQVDQAWTIHLPSLDYAIVSSGHWFNRRLLLHQGPQNATTKCVYCNEPNVPNIGPAEALGLATGAALDHITGCAQCKGLVTLLRTFSPAHFQGGEWNAGGNCLMTHPYREDEISLTVGEWDMRNAQMEELKKKGKGKKVEVVDVTKAMLMRPDGHPGPHWDNRWMGGFNDCVHWCLPGAVDIWNDITLAVIRRSVPL